MSGKRRAFGHAAHLLRARITHWWLRPAAGGIVELVRSRPTLNPAPFPVGCNPATPPKPFLDETNGGTETGVVMGSGPIEGLLVRYVLGALDGSDTPASWAVAPGGITACDSVLSQRLREVRVGVIARTATPDTDAQQAGKTGRYSVAPLDGVTMITNGPVLGPGVIPTPSQIASISDAFPRRGFLSRVVPRNSLGYLP